MSVKRYLIADKTKFSLTAPYLSIPLNAFDAVIANLDDAQAGKLRNNGINIVNK